MSAFTNKVAVITGGNSGIGLAVARELSRRGARVVISGRDEKTLAEAAASIGGDIVINTSVVGRKGIPTWSVYSASKAALRSLTRTLAAELLPRRIRVNAVAPGPIPTPVFRRGWQTSGMTADSIAAVVPMKRLGEAE